MTPTELVICTTCRPEGASRDLPAAGDELLQAVLDAQAVQSFDAPDPAAACVVQVRGIACLSACNRACTVALQAAGKHTYCFGDLVPDEETATQLLALGELHQRSADGTLARNDRPPRLRSGILVRLPPLAVAKA